MEKISRIYRYSALAFSTVFYFIGNGRSLDGLAGGVIIGLLISCIITDYLYQENQNNQRNLTIIIGIEVIANSTLIYLSGGLNSYYIWYAMNTIITLMLYFKFSYGWVNGLFYSVVMLIGTRGDITVVQLNSLLGIIFTIGGIQMFISYHKMVTKEKQQLEESNQELATQNSKNQQSLEYVMETYETIYLFATGKSKRRIIRILLDYINFVLKEPKVALVEVDDEVIKEVHIRDISEADAREIYKKYQSQKENHGGNLFYKVKSGQDKRGKTKNYFIIPVQYTYETYGFLVIETEHYHEEIKFITNLTSMIIKKIQLEQLNERFVINEERNRIANQIHDSILQKLFGISCQLYSTSKKADQMDIHTLQMELDTLRISVNETMGELRETIYGMSWNKEGSNSFIEVLNNYIEETKHRYRKIIELDTKGDLRYMDARQKEAVYRIVCEGISNAIRHGKAKQIMVELNIEASSTQLNIKDDGQGFDYNEIEQKDQFGLGIKNINYLVSSLGGKLDIQAQREKGVWIIIEMPNLLRNPVV